MHLSWSHLAAAAALPSLASAAVAVVPRAPAPSLWVSVDRNGNAKTITPTISGSSTISAPPSYLTQTGVYTLTAGAQTSTSTGLPPVATPTGTSSEGAFLVCNNNYQASGAPLCQPRRGSQIIQGKSYYGEFGGAVRAPGRGISPG